MVTESDVTAPPEPDASRLVAQLSEGACSPRSVVESASLPEGPVARPRAIHHVRLTVTDIGRSKAFYAAVLGLAPRSDFSDEAGDPAVRDDPDRLFGGCSFVVGRQILGLRPSGTLGDCFVPTRVGLDHLSLEVEAVTELHEAAARLDASQIEHGTVRELPDFGVAILSLQDPDGINLELAAPLVDLSVSSGRAAPAATGTSGSA